jgi:hypothetical protein
MSQLASPQEAQHFVDKWQGVELSERAASQEHFIDLCSLVRQPTPAQADPTGEDYCFEKPVKVTLAASKGSKGEGGFVDVWKRGCFAWEYKRKDKYKNLDEAYRQLYQYRDALDNPPLSVACNINRIEIKPRRGSLCSVVRRSQVNPAIRGEHNCDWPHDRLEQCRNIARNLATGRLGEKEWQQQQRDNAE